MKMTHASLLAATAILSSGYSIPDYAVTPDPWIRNTTSKGSGHDGGGLNVKRSRKAAKAARKARKLNRG